MICRIKGSKIGYKTPTINFNYPIFYLISYILYKLSYKLYLISHLILQKITCIYLVDRISNDDTYDLLINKEDIFFNI